MLFEVGLDLVFFSPRPTVLALAAGAWLGINRIKVDDSLTELFRTDSAEFKRYEEIDRKFPSSEYDVLVVVEGPDRPVGM